MSDDLGEDILSAGAASALTELDRLAAPPVADAAPTADTTSDASPDGGGAAPGFWGDKGRRAVRGATRTISDIPKAAGIAGRAITTGAADRAGSAAEGYGAEVAGVLEVLADPDLTPEERAAYTKLGERLLGAQEFATALAQFHSNRAETPLKETGLYGTGEAIDTAVEGFVGKPDPARDRDFTSMLAEGAGNMGAMVASGIATGSAGPLTSGISMGAVNQYEAAIAKGADEATALQAAGLGALVGSTDVLPLMYALNRFSPAIKKNMVRALAIHLAKSSTVEGAQEGLQGILDNWIAQGLYDPDKGILEGVGEQALVGAILGLGSGSVGALRGLPTDAETFSAIKADVDAGEYPTVPAAPPDPGAAARADALLAEARTDPYAFGDKDTVSEADLGIGDPNGPLVERAESPEALEAARRERAATGGAFEEARAAIDRELERIDAEIREMGPAVLTGAEGGTFTDRLIGIESAGDPQARNPNSSATGLGQFLKSTWLRVVRKYEPALAAGRTEADILALRTDPATSRRMIEHLAKENAGILQRNGFEASDGNLYLAHFAGPDGAVKLLKAGANATAESVLGKAVVDANPFLKGKTAAWVVSWAAGKIGDPRAARARIGRLRARATRLGEALATSVEGTTAEGAEMIRRATATLNAAADRAKLSDLEGIVRRITAVPDHANDMLTSLIGKLQKGETPGGKRPLARMIQSMGGVDPTSSAGVALKDAGITPRTHPGLFKSGGPIRDLSADIVGSEHPLLIANPELLDPTGRGDPNAIADALRDEAAGQARFLDPDQMEEQAALDDLSNALRDLGVDVDSASPAVVRQLLDDAAARAAESSDRLAALDEAPSPEVDPRDVSADMQEDVRPPDAPAAPDPRISADPDSPAGRIFINHARIQTTDDVHALIQETADADAEAINRRRRGVVTHEQTKKEAENEFRNVEELLGFPAGMPMNAAQAHAAWQILTSSGEQLRHLARKAADIATATDVDRLALQKAASVHYAIQEVVLGATTEAARALNALAITRRAAGFRMEDIGRLIDESGGAEVISRRAAHIVALADSPQAMNHYLRKSMSARTVDAIYELFYGAILSNPQTHFVNIAGNANVALWAVPEQLAATAISRVIPGENLYAGEAAAMAYSMAEGARAGFRLMFGIGEADAKLRENLGFNAKGEVASTRRRSVSAAAFGMDPAQPWGKAFDYMGMALRAGPAALGRADMFFKAIAYHQAVAKYAYRIATNEGFKGEAWAARVEELRLDPPAYAANEAADFADYQTFTNPLGERGKKIVAGLNATPGARLVAPFIQTPTNILKYTLQRTPLALASSAIRADIMAGGERASLALARIALGSMAMTATASLVADGVITGGGPDDPEKGRLWRAMGFQPYSVKVGDHWISYQRMDPIGMLMGITADVTEVSMEGKTEDAAQLAIAGLLAIKDNLLSKTYLDGLTRFLSVLDKRNPMAKGEDWIANTAGSFMPYSAFLGWWARNEDPIVRDRTPPKFDKDQERIGGFLDTLVRSAKSRIPGLSKDLPPKRDLWGKELSRESGLGWAYDAFMPWKAREITKDPVELAMIENWVTVDWPSRVWSPGARYSDTYAAVPMTPEEYSEYSRIAGEMAKERLDKMVASEGFKMLPKGEGTFAAERMRGVFRETRELAREKVMSRFPDLRERARQAKIEAEKKLRGQ